LVDKVRASDGKPLGSFSVGAMPEGICFDGKSIWVANSGENTITRLKASDGSMEGTYMTGTLPQDLCFDGTNVWIANGRSDNVTVMRASDGVLVRNVSVVEKSAA
jgi:DNA-binding beta-propeller fold protein YncE